MVAARGVPRFDSSACGVVLAQKVMEMVGMRVARIEKKRQEPGRVSWRDGNDVRLQIDSRPRRWHEGIEKERREPVNGLSLYTNTSKEMTEEEIRRG
uniref:Uncharacterized protein n=1 Tax=Oryza sativa subsp. japonica TaxID=39947 RepID=Q75I60_ORYSJ|nr:hypothetical protein [Oryza sativa Japonica Group]